MNLKKVLAIALAVLAFSLAAAPRAQAGVSIGIGIGAPVGYGCGYAPAYYRYAHRPYAYHRPVVGVSVRPHYHWRHHRRVHCTHRHYRR